MEARLGLSPLRGSRAGFDAGWRPHVLLDAVYVNSLDGRFPCEEELVIGQIPSFPTNTKEDSLDQDVMAASFLKPWNAPRPRSKCNKS